MPLENKVIVITGAASGMGLETARYFASKGAKLSLADIQEEPLKELTSQLEQSGAQVISQVVDVSKRDQVESWIASSVEKFGKLDGAANLAGVIGKGHNVNGIENMDDEEWNLILGINTYGLMSCMRAQIPHLKNGGAIANAASILGLQGGKNCAAYVASKHAVIGLTKAAAKELGERNIRVNCFCPGVIDTPMLQKSAQIRGRELDTSFLPLGRKGRQEEIPPLLEFLLSESSSYITGTSISVDGGWHC